MDEGQRRHQARVGQVLVVGLDLIRQEHALVDDGARRQADRVVAYVTAFVGVLQRIRDHFARKVEFALEVALAHVVGLANEHLPVIRLGGLDQFRQRGIVGRHAPPTQDFERLLFEDAVPDRIAVPAQARIARGEDVAHRVLAGCRQFETDFTAFRGHKLMRNLDQNAGAVARQRISADRAAVFEIFENAQSVFDDAMRFSSLHVGNEANAACVAFHGRIKHALGRRAGRSALCFVLDGGKITFAHSLEPLGLRRPFVCRRMFMFQILTQQRWRGAHAPSGIVCRLIVM